jgi:arsenate reductase (thioredoxin)
VEPAADATRTVLFICVENACRSLMAESMFNAAAPEGWRAESGGVRPVAAPNPRTAPMLGEIGLTLPGHAPQLVTNEAMERASLRVTMGCLDDASCPARLKTLELRDWGLPDPAALDDAGFRAVRDQLRDRVNSLRTELELDRRRRAAWTPANAP